MKITQSPPAAAFRPLENRNAAAPSPPARQRPFLDILQADRSGKPPVVNIRALLECVVEAGGQRFAVATHIGEDAVRFDARPIVAPSGEPAGENDGPPLTPAPRAELPPPQNPLRDPAPQFAHARDLGARIGLHAAMIASEIGAGRLDTRPLDQAGRGGRMASSGLAPAIPAAVLSGGAQPPPSAEASAQRPASARTRGGGGSDTSAFVRLSALPRDIILAIRGMPLSAADIRALREALRETLERHGLGDRAVRIDTMGRR